MVNKSPAAFISIREIDDLQRKNRSTISKKKEEGLWIGYEGACYYFSEQEVSADYANVTKSLLQPFLPFLRNVFD